MSMVKPAPMPEFKLKEPPQPKQKRWMKRRGKKTTAWENTKAKLKPRFRKAGIVSCEIRLPQCWRTDYLCFCHTKRRADIKTQAELERVALGCAACATAFSGMNKHEEEKILEEIIQARPVQP